MRATFARIGSGVIAAILMIGLIVYGPSPAFAANPTIELEHDNLQPEERVLLYPDTICPNAAPGQSNGYIYGTFTDASNQVFPNLFIGYSLANGSWNSGSFEVPAGAALGIGSLNVHCTTSVSGGSANRTFDPATVNIVGQETRISVDRTNVWHEAIFSSVATCEPNVPVNIQIHDQGNAIYSNNMGTTTYGFEMSDTISSDGTGSWTYSVKLYPSNGFSNPGYLYTLHAECQNSNSTYGYGSFNFRLLGDQYVALGDSYSSGVGSDNYNLDGGYCNRSTDGYPHYLVASVALDPPNFVACAGAVTEDLFQGFSMAPPRNPTYYGQLGQLDSDTEVVTLTIGGNDADFVEVLTKCAQHVQNNGYGCSSDTSFVSTTTERIHALAWIPSDHPGESQPTVHTGNGKRIYSYVEVFDAIQTVAPNAKIYIAGYPRLFGDDTAHWIADSSAPGNYRCTVHSGFPSVSISYEDAMWMNDRVNVINGAIQAAAAEFGLDVTYVATPGFYGHGLCDSGTPYINGVLLDNFSPTIESLHPTGTGMQLGYGEAFESVIN